jgi:alkylresorcinol/alkylpyrone synthase
MLDVVKSAQRNAVAAGFDVEVLSLATANPPYRLTQTDAAARARELYPHLKRLWRLYDNTGIETRYNCEPIEWYLKPHSWEERTASFQKNALDLLEKLTHATTQAAGIAPNAIDMIVTNTVTGLAVPSLDAKLINRLDLSPTIERLPMFGLGCGAGVAGLARATRLTHATDGAHVLFLTVDLCSLCMRANDPSPSMFVSTSLFGDGAAGVLLHNTRGGAHVSGHVAGHGASHGAGPRILAVGEWCWRGTEHIMGWDIKDDGFGIVLSPELPALMSQSLKPALQDFLDRNGFRLSDFNGFLFHPGGRRLLETAEKVLGLKPAQLEHSWEVLRAYGNMSSATVLFVLDRALKAGARGPHLLAAFGPGFSAYFVVADL